MLQNFELTFSQRKLEIFCTIKSEFRRPLRPFVNISTEINRLVPDKLWIMVRTTLVFIGTGENKWYEIFQGSVLCKWFRSFNCFNGNDFHCAKTEVGSSWQPILMVHQTVQLCRRYFKLVSRNPNKRIILDYTIILTQNLRHKMGQMVL